LECSLASFPLVSSVSLHFFDYYFQLFRVFFGPMTALEKLEAAILEFSESSTLVSSVLLQKEKRLVEMEPIVSEVRSRSEKEDGYGPRTKERVDFSHSDRV
jgi:hypothetical protein